MKEFAPVSNPEAVAWTIAAEGTITIAMSNSKRKKYYYPSISVSNTSERFILEFKDMTGRYGSSSYKPYSRGNGHKPCYFWRITKIEDCLDFLTEIVPYLPIKMEQAELVIHYCKRRLARFKQYNSMEDEDYDIIDRMRELNRRGL